MMGLETEYALGRVGAGGASPYGGDLAHRLLRRAYSALDCLRSESGHGVFLSNGALVYVDVGDHLEWATAECGDPLEATRQVFAGDHVLVELLSELDEEGERAGRGRPVLLKGNVDHRGATWGSHESYATVTRPHDFVQPLATFLATRIVFTGAGGLETRGRGVRFVLSPRASFVEKVVSGSSMRDRGLVHDKHEPLACAPFQRLHLTCGDSLRSHYATWLRLATAALVVAALESGARPSRHGLLPLPVAALRRINVDTGLRLRHTVASGSRRSALEIQRHYLEMVEVAGTRGVLPSWWPAACGAWGATLDALAREPSRLAGRLDWPLRLALFEARLAREGLSWPQLRVGPCGPRETPLLPWGEQLDDPELMGWLLGRRARGRTRSGRRRPDPPVAEALREIDLRFGELGAGGWHARLEASGAITHRLFDDEALARGGREAPQRGRARARGDAIRQLAGRRRGRCWASWSSVVDAENAACLDLRHPLRDRVAWRDHAAVEDVPF